MSGDADTETPPAAAGAPATEGPQAAGGTAEPTPTVSEGEQTSSHPPGSAMPEGGIPPQERPEVQVGAAFAGGLVAALLLRKLLD